MSGRIRTLLCLRMSGAGVAFPVRFFSVHFRCDALLCTSSPKHYLALLLQGVALPFFSFPMRCFAILLFPGASRSVSSALLCISSPAWGCAFLLPGVAQRLFSKALQCISKALQCISNPTRRRAVRFLSIAVRNSSSPKRCSAYPIQRVAGASIAAAMRLTVYPSRCFTLRFLSEAFHCFALLTLPLPSKTVPMPCTAFLPPGRAWPSDAFSCLCLSVPGFSGAYPLGPLPAPISVLGEELPDPALGIEWEPLCPGRGLAHDAPYILEVCLRCVGVPLDDHLVVDVKDHPVSGLLEVV